MPSTEPTTATPVTPDAPRDPATPPSEAQPIAAEQPAEEASAQVAGADEPITDTPRTDSPPLSGLALSSLALGGLGITAIVSPLAGLATLPLGLTALVLGVVALTRRHRPAVLSVLGTVFGGIAVVLAVVWLSVVAGEVGSEKGFRDMIREAGLEASSPSVVEPSSAADAGADSEALTDEDAGTAEQAAQAAFGETRVYSDGVAIAVSQPATYVPSDGALLVDQAEQIVLTFTLTNGSANAIDPTSYPVVVSKGIEATEIIDPTPTVPLGGGPRSVLLAGRSLTWSQAFSVADADDLVLDIRPEWSYPSTVFVRESA